MSVSTSIFGQVPILSLKLNAYFYLYNISITYFFSASVRHDLSKLTYLSNIFLSDIYFLLSLGSNQGYFSCISSFLSLMYL